MLEIFLICLAFGVFSGIIAGLFGIGGGLVIVPFMLVLLKAQGIASELWMLIAVATSLATIVITSLASTLTHHYLGSVVWRSVRHLSYGIVLGVIIGAWLADSISAESLRLVFALYVLVVAVQMSLKHKTDPFMAGSFSLTVKKIQNRTLNIAGLAFGFASSVLGIGGGTLIVPFLSKYQLPMRHAVAISSACGLPLAVIGTLSYAVLGWNKTGLPNGCIGYVYLPAFLGIVITSMIMAPVGAKLAHNLPTELLKKYFSLLLFAVAGKMLWGVIS